MRAKEGRDEPHAVDRAGAACVRPLLLGPRRRRGVDLWLEITEHSAGAIGGVVLEHLRRPGLQACDDVVAGDIELDARRARRPKLGVQVEVNPAIRELVAPEISSKAALFKGRPHSAETGEEPDAHDPHSAVRNGLRAVRQPRCTAAYRTGAGVAGRDHPFHIDFEAGPRGLRGDVVHGLGDHQDVARARGSDRHGSSGLRQRRGLQHLKVRLVHRPGRGEATGGQDGDLCVDRPRNDCRIGRQGAESNNGVLRRREPPGGAALV
mmetsp:Transcript_60312/g.174063  ORF Transcript_60312/g.174063 Transcript_60312/m.174063 type:complete len:265 (-) Transcript_60312:2014-2808(-)